MKYDIKILLHSNISDYQVKMRNTLLSEQKMYLMRTKKKSFLIVVQASQNS